MNDPLALFRFAGYSVFEFVNDATYFPEFMMEIFAWTSL